MSTLKTYDEFVNEAESAFFKSTLEIYTRILTEYDKTRKMTDDDDMDTLGRLQYFSLSYKSSRKGTDITKNYKKNAMIYAKKLFGGKPKQSEDLVIYFGTKAYNELLYNYVGNKGTTADDLINHFKKYMKNI